MPKKKKTSKEKMLDALQKGPMTWNDLWIATGLNGVILKRAVVALLDEGKIRADAGGTQITLELTKPPK